mmetsp:Transcript_43117/g.99321  ORF Transcript_43117/g.99321 Transcript_43117/m.99321 type:complete len:184 (+) Transcript_43117:52-603(+)
MIAETSLPQLPQAVQLSKPGRPPPARKPRRKQRPECHLWADGYGGPLRAEATADELRERAAIVAAMRAATAVQKGRPHVAQRQGRLASTTGKVSSLADNSYVANLVGYSGDRVQDAVEVWDSVSQAPSILSSKARDSEVPSLVTATATSQRKLAQRSLNKDCESHFRRNRHGWYDFANGRFIG